jgi:hypothetical protein
MSDRRISQLLVIVLAAALVCCACERIWEFSLGPGENLAKTFNAFDKSNRMVIKAKEKVKKETTDPADVADVVNFFKKYPRGWVRVSGAGGDYDIFLYEGAELIGRVGITGSRTRPGEDTLNVGDSFRRVPTAEVVVLMRRIGLPWPVSSS